MKCSVLTEFFLGCYLDTLCTICFYQLLSAGIRGCHLYVLPSEQTLKPNTLSGRKTALLINANLQDLIWYQSRSITIHKIFRSAPFSQQASLPSPSLTPSLPLPLYFRRSE